MGRPVDQARTETTRLGSYEVVCKLARGGMAELFLSRTVGPEGFEKLPATFRELSPSYRVANPEGVARWAEFESKNRAPEAVRGPAQPNKNRVTLAALEGIRSPALVIAADADPYAPPALMRRIADRIKGSQFVAIPDAGHSVWWEQPEQFNRTVLRFIAKH